MDLAAVQRLYREARWYRRYYQDIPELRLFKSERKNDVRVRDLRLDRVDFNGKCVWDLGCAGGFFLRYALDHGATTAVGFDLPSVIERVQPVNDFLGYRQIVFCGLDLETVYADTAYWESIVGSPEIVFFLSMNYHIRIAPFILQNTQMMIFEDNGRRTKTVPDKIPQSLSRSFPYVEYIGRSSGRDPTTIYHLRKEAPR
jgi:hypothetical protein